MTTTQDGIFARLLANVVENGFLIALDGVDSPTQEQYVNAREELLTEIEYAAQLEGLGESNIRGAIEYALAHYRVDGRRTFNDLA